MRRSTLPPRSDWQRRCEELGFSFHSVGGRYWEEAACYVFSAGEIDVLEAAAEELHRLCLKACERIVRDARYAELAIPAAFSDSVGASWKRRDPTLFGRFDIAWDGSGPPKLLEYNADTPTALIEASVAQWFWLEDRKRLPSPAAGAIDASADQFNSLHEKLIERWKDLAGDATIHFSCVRDHEEDFGNTSYLRDTAVQASRSTRFIFIEDIGWSDAAGCFVDLEGNAIEALFKLYPWEWLAREKFGPHIPECDCAWIEPPWKMLLSNKAMLAILWELFPGHPNLLPCFLDAAPLAGKDYVRKPILAREGANVSLRRMSGALVTGGSYGREGYVYQEYAPLARFEGNYAVVGAWIVGDRAAGIGIREDDSPITKNTSRFVPHYFE
ncbi:MAG TPA: glutathionylspermidine synthase family protein [Burkholderiales bacterium]|nr:glutathionylspermidine synthase family protein [Burkholderiales bacterium]